MAARRGIDGGGTDSTASCDSKEAGGGSKLTAKSPPSTATNAPKAGKKDSSLPASFLSEEEFIFAFGMTRMEYSMLPKRIQVKSIERASEKIVQLKFAAASQARQRRRQPPVFVDDNNKQAALSKNKDVMSTDDFFDSVGKLDCFICTPDGAETMLAVQLTATIGELKQTIISDVLLTNQPAITIQVDGCGVFQDAELVGSYNIHNGSKIIVIT